MDTPGSIPFARDRHFANAITPRKGECRGQRNWNAVVDLSFHDLISNTPFSGLEFESTFEDDVSLGSDSRALVNGIYSLMIPVVDGFISQDGLANYQSWSDVINSIPDDGIPISREFSINVLRNGEQISTIKGVLSLSRQKGSYNIDSNVRLTIENAPFKIIERL